MPDINNEAKEAAMDLIENGCRTNDYTHSCESMIDFRICLFPPPKKNTKVNQCACVEVKIEKVCKGKIIIGGIVHKTIRYIATTQDGRYCRDCTKEEDIPFSCFIDIECSNYDDKFKMLNCSIICSYSEIVNTEDGCCSNAVLEGKDIIKVTVKRIPCFHKCPDIDRYRFCSKAVVDAEICFVPSVNPDKVSVAVSIDPNNFKVKLVCCDLILVCGVITKIVTFTDDTPTVKKEISVQVNVPVNIKKCYLCPEQWKVTKAKVCAGCFDFTCPSKDTGLFHKLVEKDIIEVVVENEQQCFI
ncbi:MAG: SPOCS domain-containing protein [Clostridiaceae bacterium]